jgi:N-acetylneuraminic acid mutarotase
MTMSPRRHVPAIALAVLLVASLASAAPQTKWQRAAPMPSPRTEVAAAAYRGGIAVVGGFAADGSMSGRVDLYQPGKRQWRRLPNLPVVVNHAMAAAAGGRLYVVGGYAQGLSLPRRDAFVFDGTRWSRMGLMPDGRAAGAAAIADAKLYVVAGISLAAADLAREALVLDLGTGAWTTVPGPTPREHLAAAAAGGRVYALAGRLGDLSTNLGTFEVYSPADGNWSKLAPVPFRRGGTGAAVARGLLVSVGGEEEGGTIGSVFGYDLAAQRWRRLPNLPTPRHGLGVVAIKDRVFAVAGGTSPGLSVSGANEVLDLAR